MDLTPCMVYFASTIRSPVLGPLVDSESWKCLNYLYVNMTCKCVLVLGHMVFLVIFPSSMGDSKESIISIEIIGLTFLTFHQQFKFMPCLIYRIWSLVFTFLSCIIWFYYVLPFPLQTSIVFFILLNPFFLRAFHPPIQFAPVYPQACSTFSNMNPSLLLFWCRSTVSGSHAFLFLFYTLILLEYVLK